MGTGAVAVVVAGSCTGSDAGDGGDAGGGTGGRMGSCFTPTAPTVSASGTVGATGGNTLAFPEAVPLSKSANGSSMIAAPEKSKINACNLPGSTLQFGTSSHEPRPGFLASGLHAQVDERLSCYPFTETSRMHQSMHQVSQVCRESQVSYLKGNRLDSSDCPSSNLGMSRPLMYQMAPLTGGMPSVSE